VNLIHFPGSKPTNEHELRAAILEHCNDIYQGATHPERGTDFIMELVRDYIQREKGT